MATNPPEATSIDETRVEAFAEKLFTAYTGGMVTFMIDLADRTGMFTALAAGAATSSELADRAELDERYVRECLGGLVCGGIVEYDASDRTYHLPPEHAVCLTGDGPSNIASTSRYNALLAKQIDGVERAFREGGGVPYEAFRPEFTSVMDADQRGIYDAQLIDGILPLTGDLPARLSDGIRVADIGCGTGHSTNLLARAFPRSMFVGYDLASDAIDRAQEEAEAWGLSNVTFEVLDVRQLPVDPPFQAVFAFDAIHDQADPAGVLARAHDALDADGTFVMYDIRASSNLEENAESPFSAYLYGISILHCMTVSLALDGAGLGTVWGEQLACRMLAEAGFVDVEVNEVPDDPFNSVYVSRRP